MRRRGDTELVTNEVKLLLAAISMTTSGDSEFHGYSLAKELARLEGAHTPMSQSTLYRALRRLEGRGALQSRWESIEESQVDGRDGPPRRYYTITATGVAAAKAAVANSERAQRAAAWQTWVPSFESR
jgi:PadR family transcriptional regulator PadR